MWVHYGYNYPGLGGWELSKDRPVPLISEITKPSDCYMFMDAARNDTWALGSYRVFHRGPTSAGTPHARHRSALNAVYVDGHANSIAVANIYNPWAELGAWDDDGWWGGREPKW